MLRSARGGGADDFWMCPDEGWRRPVTASGPPPTERFQRQTGRPGDRVCARFLYFCSPLCHLSLFTAINFTPPRVGSGAWCLNGHQASLKDAELRRSGVSGIGRPSALVNTRNGPFSPTDSPDGVLSFLLQLFCYKISGLCWGGG